MEHILAQYNIQQPYTITTISSGLINSTYKITKDEQQYIVQQINTSIFTNPQAIAHNLTSIQDYLTKEHPTYLCPLPLLTTNGNGMVVLDNTYWRVFRFVPNSHSKTVVTTPQQAYQAAKQFALFAKKLQHFPIGQLQPTIPNFHHLSFRYQQFTIALANGNTARITNAVNEINFLHQEKYIVAQYENIIKNKEWLQRVTHHDTKISNVLFDATDTALCVIDLDTVMPGYYISDVGDMMRTYLSPVNEEEKDFTKITIRKDYYDAIQQGYLSEMQEVLTKEELTNFHYAGTFIIYMQALRFLTDYFNNDIYYGASYEEHNLVRARNQIRLLKLYRELSL